MTDNERLKNKLRELPDKPGCYIMRDGRGSIIYVGKAVSLRKRVGWYFRRGTLRSADPKLSGLINSVRDLDVITVSSEAEAVLTEGRLIKAYSPKYNIFFKDDKRFLLLKTNVNKPFPRFELCRIKKNDDALYFGPYASCSSARAALDFVERRFGIRRCRSVLPDGEDHKHCINDVVRFCSAPCAGKISQAEYVARVEEACAFLRGERLEILKEVEVEMEKKREALKFEQAAVLRDTLLCLRRTVKQRARVVRTPAAKREDALAGVEALAEVLGLKHLPRLIEAYDVSCISGAHAVAAVVVAENGMARPGRYRRFRIKSTRTMDDSRMMAEVISRRFTRLVKESGEFPQLVLVDGGAAQMRSAKSELRRLGLAEIPVAGLAKRFEEIYWEGCDDEDDKINHGRSAKIRVITMPFSSPALRLLQRVRDEAHRFALGYHRKLRAERIRQSVLDDIPGLGVKRKMLLLKHFGSVARLSRADPELIASVPGVGLATAQAIIMSLRGGRNATSACRV